MLKLEFRALLSHCRIVAIPVNRPQSASQAPAAADARLYLRDQDLNDGAALIRAAARKLARLAAAPVAGVGAAGDLPPPERDVIEEIFDRGPMDVGELRRRLDAPKQSMARNLNQLEARALVTRETDPRDRRRRLVKLTPAGLALAAEMTTSRREALRQAFLLSGPDAVTGARRVLSELLRAKGGA